MPTPRLGPSDLNSLRYKIRADLWQHPGRSWLAIASIAIGVFCVGALFGMIDLQLGQMDAAHRESRPSHINFILRGDADLSLIPEIQAIPGVAGVDTLTQLSLRFRLNQQAEWQQGTLIIRPDYRNQRFDRSTLQNGAWPDQEHLGLENLSAVASDLSIGDSIEVETGGGPHRFAIGGIIRHPFVKPPKFGGQIHLFADTGSAQRFGVAAHSFRQLLVQIAPYDAERARQVADEIRKRFDRQGIAVNATLLQHPEHHWGRPFIAGINQVLQLMALASLALAGVLIVNTVSAHIAQQGDQIGVMKALGARTTTVVKLYLTEIMMLASLAIMLALIPALATAHFSSCRLLDLFNVQCRQGALSPRAVAFLLAGGLLVPFSAALPPILRGAAMTVREAIAHYGLGADFGNNRFDNALERVAARRLPTLYAAALCNLFRHKARLLLTQGVLIIAGVTFLVLMSLIASLQLTLDNEMARSRYAVKLGFNSDQSAQSVESIIQSTTPEAKVETWRRLPVTLSRQGQTLRQSGSLGLQLLALPADGQAYRPLIESGRWLQANDDGQPVLVINAETAAINGITIGDRVDARIGSLSQSWQVIGTYRWLAGTGYNVEPVYAPLNSVLQTTSPPQASFALVDAPIASRNQETDVLRALRTQFQTQGIGLDVYSTHGKLEQRQFAQNQFQPVIGTLMGLASMIASVGGIGLSGTLAIGVLQRKREIGVLLAIGAPKPAIFRLFILEGLLHGLVAWLLSVPLAYVVAEPIAAELGNTMLGIKLDFHFSTLAVAEWLVLIMAIAWLASYWPARNAAKLTVRESLSH